MSNNNFKIAAAQLGVVAGDVVENVKRHLRFAEAAREACTNVVVFPELSLTGYEPTLARASALSTESREIEPIRGFAIDSGMTLVVGAPIESNSQFPYIGAFIFEPDGSVNAYRKRFLHGDEVEYFVAADDVVVVKAHGRKMGLAICADIHEPRHVKDVVHCGADLYVAGVAITPRGIARSLETMSEIAAQNRMPTVMANYSESSGGFEIAGQSAVWDESGCQLAIAGEQGDCMVIAELSDAGWSGHEFAC